VAGVHDGRPGSAYCRRGDESYQLDHQLRQLALPLKHLVSLPPLVEHTWLGSMAQFPGVGGRDRAEEEVDEVGLDLLELERVGDSVLLGPGTG
jgi:hypothetical protein